METCQRWVSNPQPSKLIIVHFLIQKLSSTAQQDRLIYSAIIQINFQELFFIFQGLFNIFEALEEFWTIFILVIFVKIHFYQCDRIKTKYFIFQMQSYTIPPYLHVFPHTL